MVVLLTQLKVFQSIGHFLPLAQIPATALSYIATQLSLAAPTDVSIDPRTTYRQNMAIRTYLGVTPWGASARAIASKAVAVSPETRLDPADVVNAAIDALIRERCELPTLSTLLRLAGNAHRRINSIQWQQVHERLTALDERRLDELLTPSADSQDSPFAVLCRGAGKATRDNLKELIAHYEWLRSLPDPAPMLTSISEVKIGQWANEAQRLKARELREYVAPRRYALVLAALRDARGRVLDDMTAMLLKFSKKVVWISQQRLAESHVEESTGQVAQTVMATTANAQRSANQAAFSEGQINRGVQTFRDPTTGKTMELSNQYDHAWLNGNNEYLMSDDPNFNPNGRLDGSWNQLEVVRPSP